MEEVKSKIQILMYRSLKDLIDRLDPLRYEDQNKEWESKQKALMNWMSINPRRFYEMIKEWEDKAKTQWPSLAAEINQSVLEIHEDYDLKNLYIDMCHDKEANRLRVVRETEREEDRIEILIYDFMREARIDYENDTIEEHNFLVKVEELNLIEEEKIKKYFITKTNEERDEFYKAFKIMRMRRINHENKRL